MPLDDIMRILVSLSGPVGMGVMFVMILREVRAPKRK